MPEFEEHERLEHTKLQALEVIWFLGYRCPAFTELIEEKQPFCSLPNGKEKATFGEDELASSIDYDEIGL